MRRERCHKPPVSHWVGGGGTFPKLPLRSKHRVSVQSRGVPGLDVTWGLD